MPHLRRHIHHVGGYLGKESYSFPAHSTLEGKKVIVSRVELDNWTYVASQRIVSQALLLALADWSQLTSTLIIRSKKVIFFQIKIHWNRPKLSGPSLGEKTFWLRTT